MVDRVKNYNRRRKNTKMFSDQLKENGHYENDKKERYNRKENKKRSRERKQMMAWNRKYN